MQEEAPKQSHHPLLVPLLALLGFVAAVFAWSAQMPVPSHTLYFVPPALSLFAGLVVAVRLHRVQSRKTAAALAVVVGLIVGVIVGFLSLVLVGFFVGAAGLEGDDTWAANEGIIALLVVPVETVLVSFIGVVRDRTEKPKLDYGPIAVSQPRGSWSPDPVSSLMPHAIEERHQEYRRTLLLGLLAFALLTAATAFTGSDIAVVSVLVVGSFFVPVVYVQYLDEIDAFGGLPAGLLIRVGGLTALFGIPSAGVLEAIGHAGADAIIPSVLTGLIEEGVKIFMVFLLVRKTNYRYELDGVILGAAAGMGFAAFEDAGYALASLSQNGIPDFLSTLWLRQVLGPFGHGTWTAAIAAILWRHKIDGQGTEWGKVLVAYLMSSFLHAMWDWDPLGGIGSFAWLAVIGGISIIRLRGLVIESIAEQRRYGSLASTAT